MRGPAGAASPVHAAALLLVLLAARVSLQGLGNTTTTLTSAKLSTSGNTTTTMTSAKPSTSGPRIKANATTQSPSNTTAHGSTKAVSTTKTTTIITTQTTISSTTSKPSTTIQSIANVTMTTSKTMSPSTSMTATPKSAGALAKTSSFDVGSFVGGIVLTLGMLALLYIGCKTYHSRRGVQYRTIDEHDAII